MPITGVGVGCMETAVWNQTSQILARLISQSFIHVYLPAKSGCHDIRKVCQRPVGIIQVYTFAPTRISRLNTPQSLIPPAAKKKSYEKEKTSQNCETRELLSCVFTVYVLAGMPGAGKLTLFKLTAYTGRLTENYSCSSMPFANFTSNAQYSCSDLYDSVITTKI